MLVKTVTYEDYNGLKRTEDFYFNFTKAELAEMQAMEHGSMNDYIDRIIQTQDQAALIKIFKEMLVKAYGVKSLDGRKFIKNDEVRDDFVQCPAYSILFMELATDSEKAAEFVNKVLPKDLADEVRKSASGGVIPAAQHES